MGGHNQLFAMINPNVFISHLTVQTNQQQAWAGLGSLNHFTYEKGGAINDTCKFCRYLQIIFNKNEIINEK